MAGVGEFVHGADSAENRSEVPTRSDTQDRAGSIQSGCRGTESVQLSCSCVGFAFDALDPELEKFLQFSLKGGEIMAQVYTSGDLSTQVRLAKVEMSHNIRRLLAPIFEDGELLRVSVVRRVLPEITCVSLHLAQVGFLSCCNSLRLATALLCRMERLWELLQLFGEQNCPCNLSG